jgi:hypothetical protein
MFDTRNDAEYVMALSATLSGVTPAAGGAIDMKGWQSLTLIVATGTVADAGAAGGFTFEVQESDTQDSGYTAVADGDLIGAEIDLAVTADATDDTLVGSIGYRGTKRYVRVVATGTTDTDAAVTVVGVKRVGANEGTATIQAALASS